ncbi:MAG: hypothetical protein Q9217_005926 [Psora testacea]
MPLAAPRPKEKIPYEIKNAREWDPDRKPGDYSSSEGSSDYGYDDDEWGDDNYSTSTELAEHDIAVQAVASNQIGSPTTPLRDRTKDYQYDDGYKVVQFESKKEASKQLPRLAPSLQPSQSHPGQRSPALSSNVRSIHPQSTTSRHRFPRLGRPNKYGTIFNFKNDNAAKAAFRKRLPPSGQFMLYKDAHEIQPDRKRMYDVFEEMGVRLNSFIRPPQDAHDRELLIWGSARQVAQTKSALRKWLQRTEEVAVPKSRAKDYFTNEASVITDRYKAEMKRIKRKAAIKKFQQIPEPGKHFEFTGTYVWPVEKINPHEIFGLGIEAFDTVRFKNKCHIIFDDREEAFKIFSNKAGAIEKSIAQIDGALNSFVAQNSRKVVQYCAELPSLSAMRQDVSLRPGTISEDGAVISKLPILSGRPLDVAARSKWMIENHELQTSNAHRVAQGLQRVITTLPFYQGQLRIRVLFGTFELRVFKCPESKNKLPFKEFLTNIQLSGTKGNLVRDMKVAKAASVMDNIFNANDLFVPADPIAEALKDVMPVISGRFVIHRFNKPSVALEIEFTSSSINDSLYEMTHALWTRYDQKETRIPFETFIVRLDGGCSWKLNISNEHILDQSRIDPKMTAFAESVKLKTGDRSCLGLTGQRQLELVQTNSPGSLKSSEFEQKTSYRYRLVPNSAWMFEIARYDCYGAHDDMPVTTNWGASMWNTDWDTVLTKNSGLTIGEVADWHPSLSTFFTSEGTSSIDPEAGVSEFLQTVQMVNDFLDEIKKTEKAKEEPPGLRV